MLKKFLTLSFLAAALILFAGEINWQSAKNIAPGVKYVNLARKEPRLMRIFIFRVDLKTPGLKFTGTPGDPECGKPMPDYPELPIVTRRQTTSDFVKAQQKLGRKIIVAVNAAPWKPWKPPYTHRYARPYGIMISDGELVWDSGSSGAVFLVRKDGTAYIGDEEILSDDYPNVSLAVTGFSIILKNGEKRLSGRTDTAPRTVYGLSGDGRYLYLMAIDGRQKNYSMGATTDECAELLLEAGAADGINMDGGGSTTLLYCNRSGKMITVNRHDPKGNYYRPVANNVGIYIETKKPAKK